ncbi:hypothetical protein SDJN03_09367, partial [Cucurbita argyrosperma subsp. sororia]
MCSGLASLKKPARPFVCSVNRNNYFKMSSLASPLNGHRSSRMIQHGDAFRINHPCIVDPQTTLPLKNFRGIPATARLFQRRIVGTFHWNFDHKLV